jgi:hypothetical protein
LPFVPLVCKLGVRVCVIAWIYVELMASGG